MLLAIPRGSMADPANVLSSAPPLRIDPKNLGSKGQQLNKRKQHSKFDLPKCTGHWLQLEHGVLSKLQSSFCTGFEGKHQGKHAFVLGSQF